MVLLLGLTIIFQRWNQYQIQDAEERAHLSTQARLADTHIGGLIRGINLALDEIIAGTLRDGHCDPILLDHFASLYPELRAFSVIDAQGINRCANRRELIGRDRSSESYIQLAKNKPLNNVLVIEKPLVSKLTGVPIIIFHKAKTDSAGRLRFVAQVSIDLHYFDTLLESMRAPHQTLLLAHASGIILSRVPDPTQYRFVDLSQSPAAFSAHIKSGLRLSTHRLVTATDRQEKFVALSTVFVPGITPSPSGHLVIAVSETIDDIYAEWRLKNWLAFTIWLIFASTIYALAWLAARRQTQLQQKIAQHETSVAVLERMSTELIQINQALDAHAIVSATDAQGKIIFANEKFFAISGYQAQELIGKNHNLINSGTHSSAFFQQMWQTIESGKNWHGLICNRAKDGHLYWVSSTIVPIFDIHGAINRYISIRTDVSAMVQIEDELRQAKKEADSANKTKSDFLSNMSHELRTPLNAILGFSQLLLSEDITADTRENVDHIHKAGKHLLTLINEVLDLAKVEAGKLEIQMEAIDVDHLIKDNVDLIQTVANSNNITLTYCPAEAPLALMADRNRLDQVLLNLISNAIKYNQVKGSVRIQPEQRANNRVRINITDTGIGLTPNDLQNLFTPFTRFGPKNIEGTGIGLALTKHLVELMDGQLDVESTPGVGSTFWVEFAATQIPEESCFDPSLAEPSAMENPIENLNDVTILCIEDNAANMRFMQKALKKLPQARILTATEPTTGLQLARTHFPNIILLDINLPTISGYEVLHQLRADPATRNIKIIAVSANAMPEDLIKGTDAGFDGYLTKPISIHELLNTIYRQLMT